MGSNNPQSNRGNDFPLHLNLQTELNAEQLAKLLTLLPQKLVNARYRNHLDPNHPIIEWPHKHTFPNLPLYKMIEDYLESKDSYERIVIDRPIPPFDYCRKNNKQFDHNCFLGHYSATDKKCKIKWVTDIPYTPTEIAIGYIRLCEDNAGIRLKVKYSKNKDLVKNGPIVYYSGRYQGEIAYIDCRHAYWQILNPTAIDMEYNQDCQEIESYGNIPYIFPEEFSNWKLVRNVLNTLYNYRTMSYWDIEKEQIGHEQRPNPLYRPYNYAYIMDTMTAIVTDCIENFPIRQWLTDAAILDGKYANTLLDFLWSEWHMDARIEAWGEGDSKAINTYSIESGHGYEKKETGHYHRMPAHKRASGRKLPAVDKERLKLERWAMINKINPISPIVVPKKRFYGWKQIELRNALTYEIPKLRSKRTTENPGIHSNLIIPENPISMYDEIEKLKGQ
jgi:hypothetical protein